MRVAKLLVSVVASGALVLAGAGVASAAPTHYGATHYGAQWSTDQGGNAVISMTANGPASVQDAKYTFDHNTSVTVYNAVKAGDGAAVGAACVAAFPEAAPVCAVAAAVLGSALQGVAPLAPNQCIQLFAKVGIPPAGARVVTC